MAPIPDDHMNVESLGAPPGAVTLNLDEFVVECCGQEDGAVTRIAPCPMTYTSYGKLNDAGDNACLVGHSLTSNTNVHEWWGKLIGKGSSFALDTSKFFVVCINYLGSPYGSASPITPFPGGADEGEVYGPRFPRVSIRDNVRAQKLVLEKLGVTKIALCTGGSMGAMLALEMAVSFPEYVDELLLIAGCAAHTDWAIGIGDVQRHTIRADPAYNNGVFAPGEGPKNGLYAARMGAMLTYRTPQSITARFCRQTQKRQSGEADRSKSGLTFFSVESYLRYQGEKFVKRFDANCYIALTHTLDSHDVGAKTALAEGGVNDISAPANRVRKALRALSHRTLVVGIDSDTLYPIELQREIAACIPNSLLHTIKSPHGHDSFLIEIDSLNQTICEWERGTYFGERVLDTCGGADTRDWARVAAAAGSNFGIDDERVCGIFL